MSARRLYLCKSGSITTRRITEMMAAENTRRLVIGQSAPFPHTFQFFEDEAEFARLASPVPRSYCILNTDKAERHGLALDPVENAVARALRAWSVTHS